MQFKSRVGITLFANIVRGLVTIGVTILLARFLNVSDYGRFSFLTATFMAVKQLLDLGSSSAFFTFLSQKTKSSKFILHFWLFFFGKYCLSALLLAFIFPEILFNHIWSGESRVIVILAMCATAMQFDFWPTASQMPESQRKTVAVQSIYICVLLLQLCVVITLYYYNILTLAVYFISMIILWFFASAIAVSFYEVFVPTREESTGSYGFKAYTSFCLPIAPLMLVGFLCDFYDRWMLQHIAGSREQAFFAISQQMSAATLLVTSALIRVFWKEIAEALHLGNESFAKLLYLKTKKILFFFGALIAAGIIPWAEYIVTKVFGNGYEAAYPVVIVMMLSSIHQTLGQVEGSFILASGKTRTGMLSSIGISLVGMLLTYTLLSPVFVWSGGLGLGAIGLALKIWLTQILSVNVLGYILSREFKISFEWLYQIKVLILLFTVGYLSKFAVSNLGLAFLSSTILGMLIYVIVVLILFNRALNFNQFLGIDREFKF